ncbi:MAG: hypothetical protein V4665_04035 [Patescibacteria group bacterium]
MKKKILNISVVAIIVAVIFSFFQSIYWEKEAGKIFLKSVPLRQIISSDMRIIDNAERLEKITGPLIAKLEEMNKKMERQKNNAIFYKLFGWEIS